jgi:hypothetical protein
LISAFLCIFCPLLSIWFILGNNSRCDNIPELLRKERGGTFLKELGFEKKHVIWHEFKILNHQSAVYNMKIYPRFPSRFHADSP